MSKKYWLHRISYCREVSYPLLEKNILSVGWSDLSTPDFIKECTNNWDNFESSFKKQNYPRARSRFSLYKFLNMKKGDYVIIPSWGVFHIYEIIEDKSLSVQELDTSGLQDWNGQEIILSGDNRCLQGVNDKTQIDLGFFRKVVPIARDISRYDYADSALTSRMKARQTTLDISGLSQSIDNTIQAFKNKAPINLYSIILNKTRDIILQSLKDALPPEKLEKLIKLYFEKSGADEVTIPSKNESGKEGDADVMGVFNKIKTIICVQAKKHDGKTNEWAIQQINDYVTQMKKNNIKEDEEYSFSSWVVSTAEFSEECINQARSIQGLLLIDGKEFARMLLEVGITPDFSEI